MGNEMLLDFFCKKSLIVVFVWLLVLVMGNEVTWSSSCAYVLHDKKVASMTRCLKTMVHRVSF